MSHRLVLLSMFHHVWREEVLQTSTDLQKDRHHSDIAAVVQQMAYSYEMAIQQRGSESSLPAISDSRSTLSPQADHTQKSQAET